MAGSEAFCFPHLRKVEASSALVATIPCVAAAVVAASAYARLAVAVDEAPLPLAPFC